MEVIGGDKVTNITYASAAVAAASSLHQLRAPVSDFVGREDEIADLLATLRGGESAAITGISGMGGIGKTELSYYVAERLRDTYPDAQLVLDMRGTDETPRDPADALASCIRAFRGLEYKTPDDLDELTLLYRSTLEGKRALILLDNARDGAQARPLLPPAGSALLITSRETIALPGMKRVTLEQLPPPEARELVTLIAPRVPGDVADQICRLCGYLPLAIRAAASLLDITPDLDAADYVSQLGDERTRLQAIGVDPLIGIDVEASIGLSYNRLTPDAARVFRRLAVFPATFDAKAEEAVCQDPAHKHLTDLLRRSLVLYNSDTRRYRLHDLSRLFADSRLDELERDTCHRRFAAHYMKVLSEAHEQYLQGGETLKSGLARFDLEWGNIRAGWARAEERAGADEAMTALCCEYPTAGMFLLTLHQQNSQRILWLESALAAARQMGDRPAEAQHLSNLGNSYVALGEPNRAINVCTQALSINREIGNRSGEANDLASIGTAHVCLDDMTRGGDFLEQALALHRETGDRRREGQDLNNLGSIYTILGELPRAVELYEQRIEIAREIGDRQGEGTTLENLGGVYIRLNEPRRAVELYEQGLAISRELGLRGAAASVLFQLAFVYKFLGEPMQALAYARQSAELYGQLESPEAEKVLSVLNQWRGEATEGE